MSSAPALRVHLLGAFRVWVDGRPVLDGAWRSARAAAIVKLLALAPDRRLHREQVMDALWPDLEPEAQANNLNVAVSRARQAIASAGAPAGTFLTRAGEMLALGPPEAVWVDADAFAVAVEGWRTLDPEALRTALALYPGDLLPDDAYEAWTEARRTALRAAALALLDRLGRLHGERGEVDLAADAYQRLVALDPANEEAHLALMRLHARGGRRAQALAQYDRLVMALRRELDAEPDQAATELAEAIRSGRYPGPDERVGAEAAASATAPALVPPHLPAPLSDLVGRERELDDVRRLLAAGRLVTLTGPGGVGKTRLALAVVQATRAAYPDGVVFVDLSPIRDPSLVVPAVAQALDVREPGGRPSIEGLATYLREQRLLLLLDNFEQVVDAAPALPALLERAAGVRVLVTSRLALRVGGEAEYPVPGLEVPSPEGTGNPIALLDAPAVSLFVRRARDISPHSALTEANAATVAEICRRLDGLPLAIELAAARIKVLTPAAMLERLQRPLALLAGGRRDLPARQQTIRNTIAWSHDLLSPPEQRLLRRLSVFVGGWTLDAAEAVVDPVGVPAPDAPGPCSAEPLGIDVLDGLASLVDKSLVGQRELPDGDARFWMLETIREFAAERLAAAGEEATLRERHAAVALEFAERATSHLEGADVVHWLARLDREDGNLRAALGWYRQRDDAEHALRLVVALRVYWFLRGRLNEGCDEALAVAAMPGSTGFPPLRVDALNVAGFFAREYGDYDRAQAASAEALAESERLGDRKRAADALANLGYVALQRGAFDEARALLGSCLEANRALGNRQGIADALSFLGLTAYYARDFATARQLDEECLAIWEAIEDVQAVVWARTRLGEVLLRQGEHERAFRALMTSLEQARELDFWWGFSWAFDGLAQLAAAGGAAALAVALAVEAEGIRERVGLLLPPAEQAEVDRLRERLEHELGATAFAEARACRGQRSLDELIQTVRDTIGSGPIGRAGIPEG